MMTGIHKKNRTRQACFCIIVISALLIAWPLPVIFGSGSDGWPNPDDSLDIGDPVSARTRSYSFHTPMLDLGGPLPVRYGLVYQSISNFEPGFQPVIPHIWRTRIAQAYVFRWGEGEGQMYFQNNQHDGSGDWKNGPYATYQFGLQEQTGANGWFYLMDPSDQTVYIFEKDSHADDDDDSNQEARLRYRMDRNGNRVTYTYSCWNCSPNTTTISDGLGREITLSVDNGGNLTTVSDGARGYTLGYNGSDQLISITDSIGNTTQYVYTAGGNIEKKVHPEGNSPYSQTYDEAAYPWGCATSQTDAYGNTITISLDSSNPDPATIKVIEHRPDGSEVAYVHPTLGASPLSWQDAQGNTANFTVNGNDQMTGITDRLGDTTSMTYHAPTGFVASFTNAKGNTLSHSYTPQNQTFTNPANAHEFTFTFYNRTRTDYPDGTYETYGYDTKGNPTTHTDRNGKTWTTTYNSQGLPLTITNPTGGVITHTYNADGTLATSADSDTGATTFGYDAYRRLTSMNPPGTGQIDITYNLMDRITSASDENGHIVQYQYDQNGNLIRVTDPAGHSTRYGYDLMDRVAQITSRTGGISTLSYNYRGQNTSATNANGIQTSYSYNNRDWLESATRNGKTRGFTQDKEGVPTGSTSPAGHTVLQQTDKLGHVTAITLPGGETTRISRDAMTRVTGSTDPLNHQTRYGYDPNGLLSRVTLPDGASADYTRDTLGNLTIINDLNGNNWTFGYTAMGRPASATDPLARTSSYTHDDRGRVNAVTYPDGVTETRSFDNTGNLTRRLYNDGTDLTYTYDALDNLTATNDLTLTRDDDGRITGSTYNGHTFGGAFDAGGRIVTATYGGAFTVTYSYNADDRLSRVRDTLGNQVDFTYDADGNITSMTRSNGINATFTRDNNGRVTRLVDGSLTDLQYGYDAAGRITSMSGTWPLDPAGLLTTETKSFTVDAASQVNSSGYAYDTRGRSTQLPGHTLTWDGAERLTGLDGVTFAYNGQSEIVSRTEGAITTRYYHNHTLGLSPIVAEQQGTSFTRYYVFTPSGQLLYSIDPRNSNAPAFYHRDQIGSTLALTDGAGTVTDSYAYGPYGKMLGHTGASDQPYTFVGTMGVRQEGDIYQMRRRYYDPVTTKFLSREPVWPQTEKPESLNPYQYALANPLGNLDPEGEIVITAWGICAVGWGIVFLVELYVLHEQEKILAPIRAYEREKQREEREDVRRYNEWVRRAPERARAAALEEKRRVRAEALEQERQRRWALAEQKSRQEAYDQGLSPRDLDPFNPFYKYSNLEEAGEKIEDSTITSESFRQVPSKKPYKNKPLTGWAALAAKKWNKDVDDWIKGQGAR